MSAEKSALWIFLTVRIPVAAACSSWRTWMFAGRSSRCTTAQTVFGLSVLRVLRRDTKSSMLETLVLLCSLPIAASYARVDLPLSFMLVIVATLVRVDE